MKRVFIISAVSLALIALAVLGYLLVPHYREEIPALAKISFGMTPSQVERQYGTPKEKKTFDSDGGATLCYTYTQTINQEEATVSFSFVKVAWHRELYQVDITLQAIDDEAKMRQIAQTYIDKAINAYQDEPGYFYQTDTEEITVGVNKGAAVSECRVAFDEAGAHICFVSAF